MNKSPKGKGGNIDVRPNPFKLNGNGKHATPEYREHPAMLEMLDKCIAAGCAVIIAGTRDGSALAITVLDGDARHRTYCSTNEELDAAILSLVEYFTDI